MSVDKGENTGSLEEVKVKVSVHSVDEAAEHEQARRARIEKRLLRKMDLRLLMMTFIYILNYIDRQNTSAARLQGFEHDLHLDDKQYSTVLSVYFLGYILMQVPSNMLLHWFQRPSVYLSCCMMLWGVVSTLTGITRSYASASLCRIFVGFVEAAYLPGVVYLISRWYRRDEVALRTTIVYCGSIVSNGWGALIASGILAKMEGVLGHPAWRWLFYIEGSVTVVVSFCAAFIIPDYPHNDRWLTHEERQVALVRLKEDVAGDELTAVADADITPLAGLRMAMADWRVWLLVLACFTQLLAQSFNIFFPTLSATMGFNTTISLMLCAPPWMFTTVFAFWYCRHSDKKRRRFVYIMWSELVGIIGFIIASSTMNIAARYTALFLMAQTYAALIVFYAWMMNSIPRPPAKRAVAFALVTSLSQLGNVAGSYVWKSSWGPSYRYSYAIAISAAGAHIILCYVLHRTLKAQNRAIAAAEQDLGGTNTGVPHGFRYLE